MADSIAGLGSATLWRIKENWKQVPKWSYEIGFEITEYQASAVAIKAISDRQPQSFEIQVMLDGLASIFNFLADFDTRKGRYNRFWFLSPLTFFKVSGSNGIGTSILCELDGYEHKGDERIYFLMDNGDLVIRETTAMTIDTENETQTFTLDTATDRVISSSNVVQCGLVVLCRLDQDVAKLRQKNIDYAEVDLRMIELVEEYAEV